MTRTDLCAFLVDLTSPLGPGAFPGARSRPQDRIAESPLAYFEALEEWASEVDVECALGLLFEIALEPPDASFMGDYCRRFRALWNEALADLAYQLGLREPSALEAAIRKYRSRPSLRRFLRELEEGAIPGSRISSAIGD